ncbi:MAG: hypothetical protein V8S96_05635 [Lachnospiraceae bacterium]
MAEPKAPQSFFDLLSEIKDYGSPEQRQAFDRFSSLLQVMTLYEQFRQTSDPSRTGRTGFISSFPKSAHTRGFRAPSREKIFCLDPRRPYPGKATAV